jgi:hypothetical protein
MSAEASSYLKLDKKELATETKAYYGQGKNQSIVHSLNNAGNFLKRSLNF